MKKKSLMLILISVVLTMILVVGCNKGNDNKGNKENKDVTKKSSEKKDYEEKKVKLDIWDITITNDEVKYVKDKESDVFFIYATAVNTSDKKEKINSVANINALQGEDTGVLLSVSMEGKEDYGLYKAGEKEIEPDKSIDLIMGFVLKSEEDVIVKFAGYTSAIKSTDVEFQVKDRISDEWKQAKKAAEEELANKKEMKKVDTECFSVDVDGDWYVDDYDDDSCKLASDKVAKGSVEGDLKITYNSFSNSAKEKAESDKKIYPKGTKIETIKIGKTQYYYFRTNTDVESGFQLYADCSDKENVVNISSTFLTKKQAEKQLKKITIK